MPSSNATTIPDDATCLGCGYALRGLNEHRCPECAREFDPTDPRSMANTQPPGWIIRAFLEPPRLWLMLISLPAIVVTAWAGSVPGINWHLLVLGLLIGIPVALFAGLLLLIQLVIIALFRRHAAAPMAYLRGWAITICLHTMILWIPFHWLSYGRVYVTDPWMTRAVEALIASDTDLPTKQMIGTFSCHSFTRVPGGIMFRIDQAGYMENAGLIYMPGRRPVRAPDSRGGIWPLYGPWYVWNNLNPEMPTILAQ